jgi:hypothetical protein
MKPKWLFEKDVFENNTDKMIKEVKSQGMEAITVPYVPFEYPGTLIDRCYEKYGPEDCVIFYGSINFGRKLKNAWTPGVYLNEKAYECSSYYPSIKNLLLHYHNFIMLPYGVLKNEKEQVFNRINNSEIFIRPNSGTKEFTGFVTTEERFEDDVKLAGFYDVEDNLICLISSAKELIREYRFVVVDGKVISGSEYRDWTLPPDDYNSASLVMKRSKHVNKICEDPDAWLIAEECAKRYNPDRAWTIDVARTLRHECAVLEIGCFSCAGMYSNNLEKVIHEVSKSALEEWKEIYE